MIIICGRYTVFTEDELIEMRYIIQEVSRIFGDGAIATGEIRPTNIAPILTIDNNRLAPSPVSWGFAKWDNKGVVINARSETALQKPMFSKPLLTRRCVIPSTGFFEWAAESALEPQLSLFPTECICQPKNPPPNIIEKSPTQLQKLPALSGEQEDFFAYFAKKYSATLTMLKHAVNNRGRAC